MDLQSQEAHSEEWQESSDDLDTEFELETPADDPSRHTFAHATAFDAYFVQNHKPSRTSAHVFSTLQTPLTTQEYASVFSKPQCVRPILVPWLPNSFEMLSSRFLSELAAGFNVLFYGAGSKRKLLNQLALRLHANDQDVLLLNAFNPSFSLKDLLASVEAVSAMGAFPASAASGIEAQMKRIQRCFGHHGAEEHLYLVIHNIDGPSLRGTRARYYLATMAAMPRIHILASADNVAFPNLWSMSEITSQESGHAYVNSHETTPSMGYNWLFHNLTTLASYDFELTYADRSAIAGASVALKSSHPSKSLIAASLPVVMTEDAARHILLSVTQKAKKLFVLLGTKQLQTMSEVGVTSTDPKQLAFDYTMLFNMARDDFIAMNDVALRALMGEFKDHRLMMSIVHGVSGNEAVWIPLRKEVLARIIDQMSRQPD